MNKVNNCCYKKTIANKIHHLNTTCSKQQPPITNNNKLTENIIQSTLQLGGYLTNIWIWLKHINIKTISDISKNIIFRIKRCQCK